MITKMTPVQSLEGAEEYAERDKSSRILIELSGTHTKSEFNRLASVVAAKGCPIEHHIISHGAAAHGALTSRRGNEIAESFEDMAFAGLFGKPPTLKYRHFEKVVGGFHDHLFFLRFDFISGKQLSLFPRSSDIRLIQLWQTSENTRWGMADPFDPAFRRDFVYLPHRLNGPIQHLASRCIQLLMEARNKGIIKDNRSGRDHLASVHNIQTHLRSGCLYLLDNEKWVQVTKRTFGSERPNPIPAGECRPWFTLADRELLQLAIELRADVHRLNYPAIAYPIEEIFPIAFGARSETTHEKDAQLPQSTTPRASAEESSQPFADLAELLAEIRERKSHAAAVRRDREKLGKLVRIIDDELTEWQLRARNLHFRRKRPIRVVAGPIPPANEPALHNTPTPPKPGPVGPTPAITPHSASNHQSSGADDGWPDLPLDMDPDNHHPLF
jgi:hypothetical protein